MALPSTAAQNTRKITYLNCITGKIGLPTKKDKKALYQILMILYAIPFTATINWLINTNEYSWSSFAQHLYMLPLMFAIAIGVRFTIANPVIDKTVKTFVSPNLGCLKKALLVTVLNILVMGTIASFIRLVITSEGFEGIAWADYAESLPISYTISFVFGYFIASPIMKKFFFRTIEPFIDDHPVPSKTTRGIERIIPFQHSTQSKRLKAA